ncbi:MAG: hypothetical protein ACPG5B_11585 [Chitinophagales bacterium]
MDKKKINELAVTIEKISYLYRSVRKSDEEIQKLEIALLKKYVIELYDGILSLEKEEKSRIPSASSSSSSLKNKVREPKSSSVFKPKIEEKTIKTTPKIDKIANTFSPKTVPAEEEASDFMATEVQPNVQVKIPISQRDTITEPAEEVKKVVEEKIIDIVEDDRDDVRTQILSDIVKSNDMANDETLLITESPEAKELNDSFEKRQNKTLADKLAQSDIKTFDINFNQRHAFVSELFNGDEQAYKQTLYELGKSNGYIEALTYINLNVRYDYRWKDDSETKEEFMNIIKSKFLNR